MMRMGRVQVQHRIAPLVSYCLKVELNFLIGHVLEVLRDAFVHEDESVLLAELRE